MCGESGGEGERWGGGLDECEGGEGWVWGEVRSEG